MGKIPARYLPSRGRWPERVYTLPERRANPRCLNSTEEPVDRHVAEGRGDRVALRFVPREIEFVESVPRAAGPAGPGTGKLLRRIFRGTLK